MGTIREFKTYKELQAIHQKEVNEFPFIFVFAFNEQEFINKMSVKIKKRKPNVNVRTMKGISKYVRSFYPGCYVFKEDYQAANDMFLLHDKEKKKFAEDEDKLSMMILSEMYNHEYGYTRDPYDTLAVLNKTENDLATDEKLYRAWSKAEQKCFASDCF